MTWPFVNYGHFASASYGGDARLIIWTLAWDNHAVLNGLPLFASNVFFPAADSLRYNEHLFGVSLATLPWAAAGASPVLAYNVTWWLAFFLNGVVAFAWIRRFVAEPAGRVHGQPGLRLFVLRHAPRARPPAPDLAVAAPGIGAAARAVVPPPDRGAAAAWLAAVLMGILTSWYMAVIVAFVNLATRSSCSRSAATPGTWVTQGPHPGTRAACGGDEACTWRARRW